MGHMSYEKVVRRGHRSRTRGFRLNPRRFSVQRLRERFLYLFRLFNRWRSSYGDTLKSVLKKGIGRSCGSSKRNGSSSGRNLVVPNTAQVGCRFARSNSFYSEAIADCLEFIKRTSISVDDNSVTQR